MRAPKYQLTDDQVYIVYLPSTEEHGPTNESWSTSLQKQFAERFRNLSFREGIIKWLNSDTLVGIDDEMFNHSRLLFIDYLKRVFNLTEIDKMEKKSIEEYLHNKLGLCDNDKAYNVAVLTGKINEISDCVNQLERMRKDICCDIMRDWSARLSKDFSNLRKYEDIRPVRFIKTGVVLPYKDIKEGIYLLIEFEDKRLIYGALYMPETKKIRNEIQESTIIRPFYESGEFIKGVDWLIYKEVAIGEGYESLKQLIERVLLELS